MKHIAKKLKSHHRTDLIDLIDGPKLLEKTQDLETAGGVIYLNQKDYFTLQKDFRVFT